jgi:hypothetical protein
VGAAVKFGHDGLLRQSGSARQFSEKETLHGNRWSGRPWGSGPVKRLTFNLRKLPCHNAEINRKNEGQVAGTTSGSVTTRAVAAIPVGIRQSAYVLHAPSPGLL